MTTTDIICTECNTRPRLKSLDKNNGTCVGCNCDGAKYSKDTVPYEYTVYDLPESWEVSSGGGPEGEDTEFLTISGHTAVKGPELFNDHETS